MPPKCKASVIAGREWGYIWFVILLCSGIAMKEMRYPDNSHRKK